MDNKKNGIPKLRFPGFTGAWEQRKLGEVVERFDNLRIPVTSSKREKGITPYYGANGIQDYVQGYTHDGEFVLVAEDGANDLQNYPVHYVNGKVWVNNHAHVLQGKNKMVDNLFLVNAIKQIKIETYLVGGSRAKLNADVMMKLPIKVPTFNEQQRLGKYFARLDSLITLHQRKLEHLQEQKKGLLQKMFPKNGETVPEVRFPGFTDAWEQRKLGDLAEIVRGASPRPISDPKWFDDNSDIGWLRISDVTNQNGRIYYLEQHISKLGQEKTRVITEPHLLLSIAATVGKPLINYIKTGVHDGFLIFLNPKFDLEYMYQWLEMFRPKWNKYGQPGSQVNLNSNLVRKQKIALPSREEQQRISSFLKQLDSLIALHQRKLEHLELMKKGLLQQMFV
ncbi:restriction endonuclease subunit S [Ligilactobacillus salivarius]|uniref:restriction endonuclease subunit S n=1 Tax=Ligilactobacillus salivarius TaxID=1624 RepID=UPI001E437B32|nr:restriction endonuclease subunit S [Ligilactobacillus salivarius]UHL93547.1 restriction endonuclease subunit S [Ligilactobacillus salivarius]